MSIEGGGRFFWHCSQSRLAGCIFQQLLNFNEKAVNFRIVITSTALEIYVNGKLFRSIPLSDLT